MFTRRPGMLRKSKAVHTDDQLRHFSEPAHVANPDWSMRNHKGKYSSVVRGLHNKGFGDSPDEVWRHFDSANGKVKRLYRGTDQRTVKPGKQLTNGELGVIHSVGLMQAGGHAGGMLRDPSTHKPSKALRGSTQLMWRGPKGDWVDKYGDPDDEGMLSDGDSSRPAYEMGHKVMRHLADRPQDKHKKAWRGLRVPSGELENNLAGQHFDLGPFASFSKDKDLAHDTAEEPLGAVGGKLGFDAVHGYSPTVLHLSNPKRGSYISPLGGDDLQREFVTGGRVQVNRHVVGEDGVHHLHVTHV
jgi:hypothetical protein